MEKYTVSGFVFDTKEEALAAKKELKAIQTICQKLDVTKPKYAKAVHDRIISKNMFHTVAGEEFLKSLEAIYEEETAERQVAAQEISEAADTDTGDEPVSSEANEDEAVPLKAEEPETDSKDGLEKPVPEEPEAGPEQVELTAEPAEEPEKEPDSEDAVPEEQGELFQQNIVLDASYFEEEDKQEKHTDENERISVSIDDDYEKPEVHIKEDDEPDQNVSVHLEAEDEQPEWKKLALEALYDEEDEPKKKRKEKKKKKTEENYQEFEDDYDLPQTEEEPEEEAPENRHYRGMFFNSFVLNIVLIAAIAFLILVAFNSENANMLNYERVLNNRYEQKEKQLEQEYESLKLELQNGRE